MNVFSCFGSSDEFTPVEDEKNNSSESSSEGKVSTVYCLNKFKVMWFDVLTKASSAIHRREEEKEEKV